MKAQHIVGLCVWLAVSGHAAAQQPQPVEQESTRLALDLNGRWQVVERTVVRRSDSNGEEHVVTDTYVPNQAAPGEPMRLLQRVDTTVRQLGPDRWVTERQILMLDANGRLTPLMTQREERTGK
jgi:hypothetical protein